MKVAQIFLVSLLVLQACSKHEVDSGSKQKSLNGASKEATPTMADHFCKAQEDVVFKCAIKDKLLSVCGIDNDRISYRYGANAKIELTIDSEVVQASTSFSGGAESHLIFSKGNYKYVVFDFIGNGEWIDAEKGIREKLQQGGVLVVKDEKQIARLECTNFSPANSFATRSFNNSQKVKFSYFN